jgi:hypothetical protein
MKSKKRKWEELLLDPKLEKRVLDGSARRFQKEKSRNQKYAYSVTGALLVFVFLGLGNYFTSLDELSSQVSFLVEEYDANPLIYIAEE